MSILDDAIREHLELKRAHGADDAELKKLEDEAFGPPGRPEEPDPFAEAPTEFLAAPEVDAGPQVLDPEPEGRRVPNIADLQEAPPQTPVPSEPDEPPAADSLDGPAEEKHPATEHEAIADAGHSTDERHAIAEQPTELFDVEGQFEDAATEAEAPSEEQLLDAELAEPRLAPADPLAAVDAAAEPESDAGDEHDDELEDEEDDFFSEQRLSDELNQALEMPLPDEPQLPSSSPPTEEHTAIFDVERAEAHEENDSGEFTHEEDSGEFEAEEGSGEFATGEHEEEITGEHDGERGEEASEEHDQPVTGEQAEERPVAGAEERRDEGEHEDLLEDTPDFLEDAPEDDELWFEQKPPKDFDFDD